MCAHAAQIWRYRFSCKASETKREKLIFTGERACVSKQRLILELINKALVAYATYRHVTLMHRCLSRLETLRLMSPGYVEHP